MRNKIMAMLHPLTILPGFGAGTLYTAEQSDKCGWDCEEGNKVNRE